MYIYTHTKRYRDTNLSRIIHYAIGHVEYFYKRKYNANPRDVNTDEIHGANSVLRYNCSWMNTMGRLWVTRGERRIDSLQINNFLPRPKVRGPWLNVKGKKVPRRETFTRETLAASPFCDATLPYTSFT